MRELAILVALVLSACAGEMSESEGGSGSAAGEASSAGASGSESVTSTSSGGAAVGSGWSSQVPGIGGAVSLGGAPSGVGGAASGGSGEGGAQGVGGAVPVDCSYPEDAGKDSPRMCSESDGIRTCGSEGCERCPTGFLDCDGSPSNSCETPESDSQCGGCTFACTEGYSCELTVLSGRDEPVEVGFRCK